VNILNVVLNEKVDMLTINSGVEQITEMVKLYHNSIFSDKLK